MRRKERPAGAKAVASQPAVRDQRGTRSVTPHPLRLNSVAKWRRRGPRLGRSLSTARLLPLAPGLLPRLVALCVEVSGVNGRGKRQGARRRRLVCGSARLSRARTCDRCALVSLASRASASAPPRPALPPPAFTGGERHPPIHSARRHSMVPPYTRNVRAQAGATRQQCRPSIRFSRKNTAFYGANTLGSPTIATPQLPFFSADAQLDGHGSVGGPRRMRQAPRRSAFAARSKRPSTAALIASNKMPGGKGEQIKDRLRRTILCLRRQIPLAQPKESPPRRTRAGSAREPGGPAPAKNITAKRERKPRAKKDASSPRPAPKDTYCTE